MGGFRIAIIHGCPSSNPLFHCNAAKWRSPPKSYEHSEATKALSVKCLSSPLRTALSRWLRSEPRRFLKSGPIRFLRFSSHMADPGFGRISVGLILCICGKLSDQFTGLFIFVLGADMNTSLCIEPGFWWMCRIQMLCSLSSCKARSQQGLQCVGDSLLDQSPSLQSPVNLHR